MTLAAPVWPGYSEPVEDSESKYTTLNISEFLAREFPPREMTLGPILPQQGLAMLYAPRGIGKTHVGLGMGYAVATGTAFLKWQAPKARKAIYVDGEMPGRVMQERIAAIVAAGEIEPPEPNYFRIMTPDLKDLATSMPSSALRPLLRW